MVPPPLTPARAVTSWTLDLPVLVVVLAAALLYLAGMRRIRRSGQSWPRAWAVAFLLGGIGTVVIARWESDSRFTGRFQRPGSK